jgi:SAM-dependent methyltransferase
MRASDAVRRLIGLSPVARNRGLTAEARFWRRYVSSGGSDWSDEYARRLDRDAPVDDQLLVECLDRIPDETVSIIDVGAGPFTSVGSRYPGKTVHVTAVDPLAKRYDDLLAEAGVAPPVRTIECAAEDLCERFEAETFDIAFARNSLDHSADPVRAIRNMLALVRPERFVVLRHFTDEGATKGYRTLHQWNFSDSGGKLVIWRPGARTDVTALLSDIADLRTGTAGAWVWSVITKRRSAGAAP